MSKMLRVLLLLATLGTSLAVGNDSSQVQIALYPYYHEPAVAWRVTILADGIVQFEESAVPVEIANVPAEDTFAWVQVSSRSQGRISHRKLATLLSQLRDLELEDLGFAYSAEYSWVDPRGDREVTNDSGETFIYSAEKTRVVTHGASYRLRITSEGVSVDSSVYAPLSALKYEDPEHPDRAQIIKIVTAWHHILKAVGPVNGFEAKDYRRWIE